MNQPTIISDSKTPLPIRVIGGILILVGIYGVLFNVMFVLAGAISFKYIVLTIFFFVVGWNVIKLKKWALYVLYLLFLYTLYYVYDQRNTASVELFVLPTAALALVLYCWHKRALFS